MFNVENLEISGAKLIELPKSKDKRGWFVKIFNDQDFIQMNINFDIKETFITYSKKGTLRGMHYQGGKNPASKLVSCIQGSVADVLVDLRSESLTFKKVVEIKLISEENKMVYVPSGVAHGFYASKDSLMLYMMNECYSPHEDYGINWQAIGHNWNLDTEPIISDRDKNLKKKI